MTGFSSISSIARFPTTPTIVNSEEAVAAAAPEAKLPLQTNSSGGGSSSSLGPKLHPKHGIPQGQGYDETRDEILSTYYDKKGTDGVEDDVVTLSIQKRSEDRETSVTLGGDHRHDPPHKGGGVATDGKYVYVADGDALYVYSRSEINNAARDNRAAVPQYVDDTIAASSYVEVKDGKLYVGDFNTPRNGPFKEYQGKPHLYQYDVKDGMVADHYNYRIDTPYYVQDVAITENGFLYSRSYGSESYSPHYLTLQKVDPETGDFAPPDTSENVATIPYYSEGISIIGNVVYVTHESRNYHPNGDSSDTHIQRIGLKDLTGIGVPPNPPQESESWWQRILLAEPEAGS